ncbi:E3 ubiquitin-protein ligase RNF138-like [Hypanus sabinus]|uniref:E3 ubiquitin-protein ligase RNF138-like n=1 Tax=Hypanus sabinus TaxID=79690 RepID=UPI0028C4A84A|nr:E3 ubiquitin-protein ligase RNF138-like [Hypanus sabinus]
MASRQNHGESPALQESKEFECPVCLQVLERPVRTQCGHIFCECCHHNNFTLNGGKCPLCRGVTSHREPFATDVETRLRSTKAKCQDCGSEMYLIFMRKHVKVCSKVLEDPNQLTNTCTQPTARHATPSTLQPIRSTEMLPTYSCPYCHARDYDEISLIQHCQTVHYLDHQRVVCPSIFYCSNKAFRIAVIVKTTWPNQSMLTPMPTQLVPIFCLQLKPSKSRPSMYLFNCFLLYGIKNMQHAMQS